MTDVLLINPSQGQRIYQGLDVAIEPPLWCRLIAGYLRDRGWDVAIWDMDALLIGGFLAKRPKLVVIVAHGHQPNASAQTLADVPACIQFLRSAWSDIPVAICGGTPSALPQKVMAETGADYVIVGEGPAQIDAILRGWPGEKRHDHEIVPSAPLLSCDDLHGNAWDLLPMDRYRAHNWQCLDGSPRSPYASIYTSLGCPHACSFCPINAPFGGRGYRTRKPEDVVAEVRMLHDTYGVSTFKIADEMFVLKPSHYLPICEGLAALPFADELNIWAYARVDTVKGNLDLMRRAGIRWLALGIESGSAHVRDGAEKSINEDDIHDVVRQIQAAGINVLGNFIFGLPDDTRESMQETLDLAQSLNCEWANFYAAMAYPGSKLHGDTPPEHLPKTWSGYSQHSLDCTPLPTATLSSADVLTFRDEAFHIYFENPRYLEMLDSKFGPAAVQVVREMTSHRLERELAA